MLKRQSKDLGACKKYTSHNEKPTQHDCITT